MKILAPTDFSSNSKAGMRFAIQLAAHLRAELVFTHVFYTPRPFEWTNDYFFEIHKAEADRYRSKLEKFVASVYRSMQVKPGTYSCVLLEGLGADNVIMEYCRRHPDIDFVCLSTRGAGRFKKIFGTHTGNLITKSEVPVIAVPKNYRRTPIKSILYATDFRHYEAELKKVLAFAGPLQVPVEVLHFSFPQETLPDEKTVQAAFKERFKFKYGLKLHIKKDDLNLSLIENLRKQIRVLKPSLLVMFTNQNRSFFERLFLSSKAEELSFQTDVPLLVFGQQADTPAGREVRLATGKKALEKEI